MKGLSDNDKVVVVLIVVLAIMLYLLNGFVIEYLFYPGTNLFHPAGPIYPANDSYVIVKQYQLNKVYFTNVTIYVTIKDDKLPSAFITGIAIPNVSSRGNLTFVPVKIVSITDVYNNSRSQAITSNNPEEVPIKIGYNLLMIKGIVQGYLNLKYANSAVILISFSNNETIPEFAVFNVTRA